jgi:hypothetical protein
MREIFTSGTVGGAPGNRCFYLEVDRCEYYEDSRLKNCCDICIDAMLLSGHMLDENIECRALKLPPRLDANDIACQWEYILKSS